MCNLEKEEDPRYEFGKRYTARELRSLDAWLMCGDFRSYLSHT